MDNQDNLTASPIELYYLSCKQELDNLTSEHTELILRISGLSDPILQEHLSEEYVILDEKLASAQAKYNEAKKLLINSLISDWFGDYLDFYRKQFITSNPIECLEKINHTNLTDDITKLRIRVPQSMKNKREMSILANTLKKRIVILDYDSTELDTIGSNWLDSLTLYVDADGESIIPKALLIH